MEQSIDLHERINGEGRDLIEAETFFSEALNKALDGLSPNDVMDAYDDGLLPLAETEEILNHMGHPELVAWIEAQEEEQSIRH